MARETRPTVHRGDRRAGGRTSSSERSRISRKARLGNFFTERGRHFRFTPERGPILPQESIASTLLRWTPNLRYSATLTKT